MEKLEEATPEITVKLSDLIDLSKLRQKLEEGSGEITFCGKCEQEEQELSTQQFMQE